MIYLFGERSAEELRPREALLDLVQNTYMNWLLEPKHREVEFEELCNLVRQVPVRRIVAHVDAQKIGALCELIVDDAESHLPAS